MRKTNLLLRRLTVILMSSLLLIAVGCKKGKPEMSAKSKLLMKKTWKLNAEASRTAALTKAGKATGITNLKDIKLKGDVKKMANFVSAKTLYFGFEKNGTKLVFQKTTGKSLLKSTVTGYWKWNKGETGVTLIGAGKNKGKDTQYTVQEVTEKKLILVNDKTKVPEVYTR